MTARPLVLLVEDDRDLRGVLRLALQGRGYDVLEAASGNQALARFREASPQLMIVDLGLPDIDGVDVTWRVRREHELPIIVLSARTEEAQQIRAFDAGANDYVTKPFREGELMARVRSALRYAPNARAQRELRVGAVRLDTLDRKVFVEDVEVEMTPTEFKLLHVLACDAGRVVTHRRLLGEVWGAGCREVQYLRVYMRQLRNKIEADSARPKRLLTVLGVGYRFGP
ncbi:MAG TPA: response regulator [Polyangiaceae bacterium]|nr:response regulator [Polyangiaceae bacterium]